MPDSLYTDLVLCFLVAALGCVWWSYRKQFLKERWKETVAVSIACGFIGFLFYLVLRQLVPVVGLSPSTWLTVPATVLMVWVYYDVLLLRHLKESEKKNA